MKQLFKTVSLNFWFERSQKRPCKIIGAKKNKGKKNKETHICFTPNPIKCIHLQRNKKVQWVNGQ